MEDDAVAGQRSYRRGWQRVIRAFPIRREGAFLLAVAGGILGARLEARAETPSFMPLRPFAEKKDATPAKTGTALSPEAGISDDKKPGGLPPLPLFAQQTQTPESLPFATPPPGSVVDEDEEENAAEGKKAAQKEKRIECDTDAQCPAETVCARHVCKSMKPMTSAILYFHRPGPIGFRMVLPFYYSFWHPQHSKKALIPLFVEKRDHEEKTRDLWVFPTIQYHRGPDEKTFRVWPFFFYGNYGNKGRSLGLLPFFYSQHRDGVATEVIPPLLFVERRDEKERERDTLFLPALLYVRQRQDDTLALFLGLGYYRRSAEKVSGGYFPLVFYSANQNEHKTAVLPLFFEGGNHQTGSRYATLFPLFLYYKNASKDRLWLTPLGGFFHDEAAGEDTLGLLVPPLLRRETPAYRLSVLLPLAAWWHNKQSGHRFGFAGPFFYSRDDEGGSDGLFPLFLRFESYARRASTAIVPPLLAAWHRSPELRMGFLGPLYGWSRTRDHAYGGGLLPLLSFASGPRAHLAILPPLFVYSADRPAGRYHLSIGPFFYRHTTQGPDAGYDTGLFPLLFVSHHGARRTEALLPLFYHQKQPYQERLIVGPFYYDRACPRFVGDTRAAVRGGFAPFLFFKRSAEHSYTVVLPLFFEARTRTASTLVAGPFFYNRKKLPGAEGEQQSFGILPLFYARRSPAESLVLAPLVGYHRTTERRTLLIGPYVENVSAPGRPEQGVTRLLFPLYFFHCSPGRRATVLFPLFMQVREEQTTFRSALFLYYGVETKGNQGEASLRAHAFLPLLFFSLRAPGRSTTVLGPFFHHRNDKDGELSFGLLPLFGYRRNLEQTMLATPIGFYQRDHIKERSRSAFLLFYGDFQRNRADFGVFPLFFATRRDTARAVFVSPFFYHSRDPNEGRAFTLLGPLFFGHKKNATYGGFAPLVYGRNDGDGGFGFFLFPLVYASHRPAGANWMLTPLFGFKSSPEGYRFYLGPLYVRRDTEQRSLALLPLFYDGEGMRNHARVSFLLPLFFRSATPDKSLTMVTPLFWHQRTLTQRVTLLFPLALDINNLFRERTTAVGPVVPLFVRMRDEGTDTTRWLFPPLLTYVRRAPGEVTAITFPIFWHWKSADRQTTVLFPLVYYASRPAKKTVAVLPLFGYHRDEHDNRSMLLLPLLTWWRNGGDGSRERVVFPLFWHFKNAERQTTVFFPLVFHAKRPHYTVTVFLPFGAHWRTERGHSTLVLNTYVYKGTGDYKGAWDFHFWPLFSVGRPRPQDLRWTILAGLLGYSREGRNRTLQLLWGVQVPLEPVGTQTAWYGATWRMAGQD